LTQSAPVPTRILRLFGLGLALLMSVFAALAWRKDSPAARWELGLAAAAALASLAFPRGLEPIYRAWMPLARALGRANTFLALALLYYLIITPYAALLRLFGVPFLDIKRAGQETFWRDREPGSQSLESYTHEF